MSNVLSSSGVLNFTVNINDSGIGTQYNILSITVCREVNKIPWALISIVDGGSAEEDFPVSNEALFEPGNKLSIDAGYDTDSETIFKGIIVRHSIKIRPSAQPQLTIECRDEASKLTLNRASKYFTNKKDSEAIEEILDDVSLEHDVEPTATMHEEIIQYNCSDWDFIVSRAEVNGKLVMVNDGIIDVKAPDFGGNSVLDLTFGDTIEAFDGEMDARYQYQNVEALAWDMSNQELKTMTASDPGITEEGNLASSDLASVFSTNYQLRHGAQVNENHLQEWADAQLLKSRMAKIRGRVRFMGFAEVIPGDLITLDGLGDRFNGTVWVSGIRHELANGGWSTDVQYGLSPNWFAGENQVTPPPAGASLPAIHGLHVGIVTGLEDPEKEFRVCVKMPLIDANDDGIWCRVATLDAGNNRGTYWRPEVNDEVVLGFFDGDPRYPVILGMLHSSKNAAPITPADANNEKGYQSRSEMKLFFDDDKKSITISTPAGKKIILDEQSKAITISDENNNTITVDSNGVKIESGKDIQLKATGDVKIEGVNVTLNGSASTTVKSSGQMEVSGGGTTTVKGAMVQIN